MTKGRLIKAKEIERRYGAPSERALLNRKAGTARLTRIKIGRSVYFDASEVEKFIEECIARSSKKSDETGEYFEAPYGLIPMKGDTK